MNKLERYAKLTPKNTAIEFCNNQRKFCRRTETTLKIESLFQKYECI